MNHLQLSPRKGDGLLPCSAAFRLGQRDSLRDLLHCLPQALQITNHSHTSLDGPYSLDYNSRCDFDVAAGPSSMGTGFHTVDIPDKPTIDPSRIRAVSGESSSGLLLSENVGPLQANELYFQESLGDMPFEAVNAMGAAPVDVRNMLAHTYPHTIGPDCSAKIPQYVFLPLLENLGSILMYTVMRWLRWRWQNRTPLGGSTTRTAFSVKFAKEPIVRWTILEIAIFQPPSSAKTCGRVWIRQHRWRYSTYLAGRVDPLV